MVDKSSLKRCIDKTATKDLLILTVNGYEKNSLQMCQKEIDRFINKSDDYVITVMKR